MHWREFEILARKVMANYFGVDLKENSLQGIPKRFDMVSEDGSCIGDAKDLSLVKRTRTPPAKFMEIGSHVWLLEKTNAKHRFLVFGNQREVPEFWLKKYGGVVHGIEFFFIHENGALEKML